MLLKMIRFCLDAKQNFNKKVEEFDLTFSQWQVLKVINSSPEQELTMNEIVKVLNSDKATISLIIKKLKEKEMLQSSIKEQDKRKAYLSLTQKMKSECIKLKKVEEEFVSEMFSNLSKNEIDILEKLIKKI